MIVLLCAGAVRSVVSPLMLSFDSRGGPSVQCEYNTAGAIATSVAEGIRADVIVATSDAIAMLAGSAKVARDSIQTLGSLGVGVAVRAGAPKPDIHDADSFVSALVAAASVAHGSPAKGGQSGIHISRVLTQLGLGSGLGEKLRLYETSRDAFEEVANGNVEIGLGQISEIVANAGLTFVGPFPFEIQSSVTFAAGIHRQSRYNRRSGEVIDYLTSPAARDRFRAAGFTLGE